jgi:hypothetical protein
MTTAPENLSVGTGTISGNGDGIDVVVNFVVTTPSPLVVMLFDVELGPLRP